MLKVAIIVGSTRPERKAEAVARWVYDIASRRSDAAFEIVDIKDFNLPLLDEPVPAAMGQDSQPHTKGARGKLMLEMMHRTTRCFIAHANSVSPVLAGSRLTHGIRKPCNSHCCRDAKDQRTPKHVNGKVVDS